jgi:ABC-type transporter Mla MlaB component
MATKDTTTGLLARVANFVRSTPANTQARDSVDPAQAGESAKLSIKRMIERKAHNDSVRKREFSQLRKLRQVSPAVASELVARASFFSDSSGYSDQEDRSTTLKKIDEIEAQMSQQWWKSRETATPQAAEKSRPMLEQKSSTSKTDSEIDTCAAFAATELSGLHASTSNMVSQPGPEAAPRKPVPPRGFEATDQSAFSTSKMVLIDMGQAFSDPTLEDAAIRFANSDDAGAETVLKVALQSRDAEAQSLAAWTDALLDLYRATGQQASFDSFAMDIALRFDRPQPLWFSTPAALGHPVAAPSAAGQGFWVCPATLDSVGLEQLKAHAAVQREPVRLDWRLLKAVAPDVGQALCDVLAGWCVQPVALHFEGLEVLDHALQELTPVGVNQAQQFWWHCRLNVLRILGSRESFDLLAMEFCITFDVSPPSWQAARCKLKLGLNTSAMSASGVTVLTGPAKELSGEVIGSVADGLRSLQTATPVAGRLVVDCDRLIRVDFSAAGSILNWVVIAKTAGTKIELQRVPCLVAAFFNLIGINEHAQVTVRINQDA